MLNKKGKTDKMLKKIEERNEDNDRKTQGSRDIYREKEKKPPENSNFHLTKTMQNAVKLMLIGKSAEISHNLVSKQCASI